MNEEVVEIPTDAVIVVKGPSQMFENVELLTADLHERFPKNLVVWLSDDATFETMPLDLLRVLLTDLIEHTEAVGE